MGLFVHIHVLLFHISKVGSDIIFKGFLSQGEACNTAQGVKHNVWLPSTAQNVHSVFRTVMFCLGFTEQ